MVIALPQRIDLSNVATVAADIRSALGANLQVDASHVTHLGALGVQALIAANHAAGLSGHTFEIYPRSEAFDETIAQFGLEIDALQTEVEA